MHRASRSPCHPGRAYTLRLAVTALVVLSAFTGKLQGQQAPVSMRDITLDTAQLARMRAKEDTLARAFTRDTTAADSATRATAESAYDAAVTRFVEGSSAPIATECLLNARRAWSRDPELYSYGCPDKRLRLGSPAEADEFFGGLNTGGVVALSVAGDQSALYTELVSDNIWLMGPLGFGRVGISAQVGAQQDSGTTTATQFFQGGGNAVLYLAIPLASYLNFGRLNNPMLLRRLDLFAIVAGGADVPKLGGPSVDPAGSIRGGVALQGHLNTEQRLFRFFVDANGHVVQGTSAAFYRNLTGRDAKARLFLSGTATLGVDIQQTVRLGIRFAGSQLISQRPQFTVQLLTN